MDSLSSVSPSVVLPPSNHLLPLPRMQLSPPPSSRSRKSLILPRSSSMFRFSCSPLPPCSRKIPRLIVNCRLGGGGEEEARREGSENDKGSDEVDRAIHLDGTIPGTSDEFVRQVSSRAYDMRRHLHESFDASSYDVLEANPWRESSKPVYVLTHRENQLCTMKTRSNRSEVENELGLLFSKGGKRRPDIGNQSKQSRNSTKFQMLVEDIREGVLVFEDETEATRYCGLMQGGGKGCEGVAEIEASSVFDICHKMRAFAVCFRRGRTPPLPQSLELNLRARKRSLED